MNSNNATTVLLAAAVSAVTADQFTLNWTTTASDVSIQWIALGGDDISAKVGIIATGTAVGSPAVTGLAFQPKLLLGLFNRIGGTAGTFIAAALEDTDGITFGAALSSTNRWCASHLNEDAAAAADCYDVVDNALFLRALGLDGAASVNVDFNSFQADGFTLDVDNPPASNSGIGYLALGGAFQAAIGTDTQRTTVGTQNKTGHGFDPAMTIFAGNNGTTLGTVAAGTVTSFGVGHGAGERSCGETSTDAADPTETARIAKSDKCIVFATGGTPTVVAEADWSSITDGYQLNWTTADATARLLGFVSLAAAGGTVGDGLVRGILLKRPSLAG